MKASHPRGESESGHDISTTLTVSLRGIFNFPDGCTHARVQACINVQARSHVGKIFGSGFTGPPETLGMRSLNESGRYGITVPDEFAEALFERYPAAEYPQVQSVQDALLRAASEALEADGCRIGNGVVVLPRGVYEEECL